MGLDPHLPAVDAAATSVRAAQIMGYLAVFIAAFILAGLALRFGVERVIFKHRLGEADAGPGYLRNVQTKADHYRERAAEFNLIYVGDSRTLCGIDPGVVDSAIGTRSFNLAHWAHWFDTQYPSFTQLVSQIPESTT